MGLNFRREIIKDIDLLGDFLSLDLGLLFGLSFLTDIKGTSSSVGFAGKIKNIVAFKVYRNMEVQLLIDTVYYSLYLDKYINIDMGLGLGFRF